MGTRPEGEDWLRYLVETFTGIEDPTDDVKHAVWIELDDGKQVLEVSGLATFAFQAGLGKLASFRRTGVRPAQHVLITSADRIHVKDGPGRRRDRDLDAAVEEARARIGLAPRTPLPDPSE